MPDELHTLDVEDGIVTGIGCGLKVTRVPSGLLGPTSGGRPSESEVSLSSSDKSNAT